MMQYLPPARGLQYNQPATLAIYKSTINIDTSLRGGAVHGVHEAVCKCMAAAVRVRECVRVRVRACVRVRATAA